MDYDNRVSVLLVRLIDEVENNTERDEFTFYRNGFKIKLTRLQNNTGAIFSHEVFFIGDNVKE